MYGGSTSEPDRARFRRDLEAARDARHELRNSLFAIEVGVASLAATDDADDRGQLARALQQETSRARALSEDLSASAMLTAGDVSRQPRRE